MTILDKVKAQLSTLPNEVVQQTTNTEYSVMYLSYWHEIDIMTMTVSEYAKQVNKKQIPSVESITRALRKARQGNILWQKPQAKVDDEVQYILEQSR